MLLWSDVMHRIAYWAVFIIWLTAAYMRSVSSGAGDPETTRLVLVTTRNVNIGEPFSAENLSIQPIPPSRLPADAVTRFEEVAGSFSRQYLFDGTPLRSEWIMHPVATHRTRSRNLRVLSIPHREPEQFAPGDRVDVYLDDLLLASQSLVFSVATDPPGKEHHFSAGPAGRRLPVGAAH